MLKAGIVGLPNTGKSTLFNAMTRSRKAEARNYPFCTIEPNVGMIEVPDERLKPLAEIVKTSTIIPAAIEIVDIAGLVAGASRGEGLGNKFLSKIREVDAIVHVVRCFDDEDIIHSMGSVDPIRDIETITLELILSDFQSVEEQLAKNKKKARGQDKEALANVPLLERLMEHLNENKAAHTLHMNAEEQSRLKQFSLLSSKPILYACNVSESSLVDPSSTPHIAKVRDYVQEHHNAKTCVICVKLEEDLIDFSEGEAVAYRRELAVEDSGVSQLICATYDLLGLASYFTAGEKEVHTWTFKRGMTAPQCAGLIHTDFEKGFIKAEVISYEDLMANGSMQAARQAGKYRLEGKDYLVVDGDIALFRFNPHTG